MKSGRRVKLTTSPASVTRHSKKCKKLEATQAYGPPCHFFISVLLSGHRPLDGHMRNAAVDLISARQVVYEPPLTRLLKYAQKRIYAHVKWPLKLPDLNENGNWPDRLYKIHQYQINPNQLIHFVVISCRKTNKMIRGGTTQIF